MSQVDTLRIQVFNFHSNQCFCFPRTCSGRPEDSTIGWRMGQRGSSQLYMQPPPPALRQLHNNCEHRNTPPGWGFEAGFSWVVDGHNNAVYVFKHGIRGRQFQRMAGWHGLPRVAGCASGGNQVLFRLEAKPRTQLFLSIANDKRWWKDHAGDAIERQRTRRLPITGCIGCVDLY
ncbi:hypothetical protein PGTUg99_023187 [Puccinia graminis f. sp. tritici]|uniref:Uncharacterized protein n=1 Tax=Puccinia graminis f. sp. tritici TaxID=56615 RepID=A0A5B0S5V0_PUCGR|nr:hypothetical protein PGTUg99_023187 [Puccinia graminis f. sp. tritici]